MRSSLAQYNLSSPSLLGSISSRFASPRSLPHATAGSLVPLIYFWTNHSQACKNRAGLAVIGQFSLGYPTWRILHDDFTSSLKCVSQRFNIKRFRETEQETIVNFLKGKDVLVLQLTSSGKCLIFQSIQIRFLPSIGVKAAYIWDEKMTNALKRELRPVYFKS